MPYRKSTSSGSLSVGSDLGGPANSVSSGTEPQGEPDEDDQNGSEEPVSNEENDGEAE